MKIELIKSEEWDKTFFKVITDDPYSAKYFLKEEEAQNHYDNIVANGKKPPVLTVLKSTEI